MVLYIQGIIGCTPNGKPLCKPYIVGIYGLQLYSPFKTKVAKLALRSCETTREAFHHGKGDCYSMVGGWTTPFEKYGPNWILSPGVKNKTCLKPPPSFGNYMPSLKLIAKVPETFGGFREGIIFRFQPLKLHLYMFLHTRWFWEWTEGQKNFGEISPLSPWFSPKQTLPTTKAYNVSPWVNWGPYKCLKING